MFASSAKPAASAGRFVAAQTASVLCISLFGELDFSLDGHSVAAAAWQRSHAKRLVQLLCSAPKFSQRRAEVLDALWPGFDDARARNRLHHTVHCIRKAWEELPINVRPQLHVGVERIDFIPAPGTLIDMQAFVQAIESDSPSAQTRLTCLEQVLGWFDLSLAAGWDGCALIDARRAGLARLYEAGLREAISHASELELAADAARWAGQLAFLLADDATAQCDYALLLADDSRPDAALLHCQRALAALDAGDRAAQRQIEQAKQNIQQRANRRPAAAPAGASLLPPAAAVLAATVVTAGAPHHAEASSPGPSVLPALESASASSPATAMDSAAASALPSVPLPNLRLIGCETLLQTCCTSLEDPFAAVVSLVGPPGCGKSLLAATAAQRVQGHMKHGALWLDCTDLQNMPDLLNALGVALQGLCGGLTGQAAGLRQALHNKELLIVLDGVRPHLAASVRWDEVFALAGRDTRWLLTAWQALQHVGERVLQVEASRLTRPGAAGAPSSAAQILRAQGAPGWQFEDNHALRLIEQIAGTLDGLPASLALAAQALAHCSPKELWQRLQREPSALLRGAAGDERSPGAALARSVDTWLASAMPAAQRLLHLLKSCQSWLTRDDITRLWGQADPAQAAEADRLIEHCVRHQFLLRRIRADVPAPWSEFRVPSIVSAALRLRPEAADPAWCTQRLESWLLAGCPQALDDAAATPTAGSGLAAKRWFDDHLADLDGLARDWLRSGRLADVAALCAVQAAHWSAAQHAPLVLHWLVGLGEEMPSLAAPLAARLLIERARLRVHLGQLNLACDDASRALSRSVIEPNLALRQQALQLIQRYGAGPAAATPRLPGPRSGHLSGRGVEAGESLLRVAQLAVRHGQLKQAQSVCGQAQEVFVYFGLNHGLVKAHQLRAKIAFALGDTETASRSLADLVRVADRAGDQPAAARARLMQADVLLARMQFAQAIELASNLVAQPELAGDAVLVARGTAVVAWAHYGQGAYPLAQALCSDLREQAAATSRTGLRVNVELLSALIAARRQRPEAAIRSACNALELLAHSQPLPDAQSDLVNVAELATLVGRHDLARPMLQSLQAFAALPEHCLRDWVQQRLKQLADVAPSTALAQPASRTADMAVLGFAEVLKSLVCS